MAQINWGDVINNVVTTAGGILSGSGQSGTYGGGYNPWQTPPFNPNPPAPQREQIDPTLLIGLGIVALLILKK